jgi:hypothetical protein
MVTRALFWLLGGTVHAPLAVMAALLPVSLVVVVTLNVLPYAALDGAPVNVVVGVALLAVVD